MAEAARATRPLESGHALERAAMAPAGLGPEWLRFRREMRVVTAGGDGAGDGAGAGDGDVLVLVTAMVVMLVMEMAMAMTMEVM